MLDHYGLKEFDPQVLNRTVELQGKNLEKIIRATESAVLRLLDRTSVVIWGKQASLAKYGYSRDGRPDEGQVNIGVA